MVSELASESDSADTDTHINASSLAARLTNTATTIPILADSTNGPSEQSGFNAYESGVSSDKLDGIVSDVTTIAQSRCEHGEDYTDIETLVCDLPVDHLTFAAHDSLASYSGPYPMAIHLRAFLLKKINGWDETSLHDYLWANPSLRQNLGFETHPNQSTFWRAWNHHFLIV